jgi:hypothetical protein
MIGPAVIGALSQPGRASLGAGGAVIALAITQVLPAAIALGKSGVKPHVNIWRVIGWLGVLIIYLGAGAASALVFEAVKVKDAITYGMAWQALLGGVMKTARATLPPGA